MAEFINTAEDLIKVYYYVTERIEQYDYDAGGNRIEATISQRHTETTNYSYYSNSIRLKSNGKYAYIYDDNGNLIKKGTSYTISGDSVTIDPEGEEYWEYQYDLLDRLISVRKNGVIIANYTYNHKGLRLKKENYDTTTYYVFGINDTILYEQENDEYSEYIYVGGQHFARVDGNLISAETTTYFYHTDHLGSTVLVTNSSAEIVWSSDYTPFGSLTMEEGELGFQKAKKFTGKDLEEDTGLYYYNARWYDAEIGRFTSADSYKGELENPQTLNLYIYTANNPLVYVDPSGHMPIGPINTKSLIEEHEKAEANRTMSIGDLTFYGKYYDVNKGDTLSEIVDTMYDTDYRYGPRKDAMNVINNLTNLVADINQLEDANEINPGQELFFPDVMGNMHGIKENRYNLNKMSGLNVKNLTVGIGTKLTSSAATASGTTVVKSSSVFIKEFLPYLKKGRVLTGMNKAWVNAIKGTPKSFAKYFAENIFVKSNNFISTTGEGIGTFTPAIGMSLNVVSIVFAYNLPVGDETISQLSKSRYSKYGIYYQKDTGRMRYVDKNMLRILGKEN